MPLTALKLKEAYMAYILYRECIGKSKKLELSQFVVYICTSTFHFELVIETLFGFVLKHVLQKFAAENP